MAQPLYAVTGAFGYSGRYIALRLLERGIRVRTLTRSAGRQRADPRLKDVEVRAFGFPARGPAGSGLAGLPTMETVVPPAELVESLRGVEVLINTYWVRFNHRTFTFRDAVHNTHLLFAAARAAGVRRVVHVSITKPDDPARPSRLEYFHGKGILEASLRESGLSYAILRPAVLFGKEDILINNIAWLVRRMPFFGVFGDGLYKLQPIYVDDLAALAVDAAADARDQIVEAIGPETFTYRGLAEAIAGILGKRRRIVSVPPGVGYAIGWLAGGFLRDVVITRDEIVGLMENRLVVDALPPPQAIIKLTEWASENRNWLGSRYASELGRRRDRVKSYV